MTSCARKANSGISSSPTGCRWNRNGSGPYRPGLTDGEIRLTGLWDDTASTGSYTVLSSLLGIETTVGYEYGPEGNTAGMIKYSGECVLTQYDESSPVDDMVAFTATLKISGDVTAGTF